jgi:hypothetical protein
VRRFVVSVLVALAFPASAWAWGGSYPVGDGQNVTIEISDLYPVDATLPQTWATYLGTLVHGAELSRLTLHLLTYEEVTRTCGDQALACYNPRAEAIYATPDDQPGEESAQHVVAHEYGHHVANNRTNPPWRAVDWGTKRWASYENVCARTAAGELHPGDEGTNYTTNPGEAFAETYRVLNERNAGGTSTSWGVVEDSLYPDPHALDLLQQDVLSPLLPTRTTLRGSFGAGVARTFVIKTPFDGSLALALHPPAGSKLRLSLYTNGRLAQRGTSIHFSVCGQRSLTLKVDRLSGRGAFTVGLVKP